MPNGIEDYSASLRGLLRSFLVELVLTPAPIVHRIGRTGRAGAKGTAYSYFTPDQSSELSRPVFVDPRANVPAAELARDLVKILSDAKQPVPPQLQELTSYGGGGGGGRGGGYRGGGGGTSLDLPRLALC